VGLGRLVGTSSPLDFDCFMWPLVVRAQMNDVANRSPPFASSKANVDGDFVPSHESTDFDEDDPLDETLTGGSSSGGSSSGGSNVAAHYLNKTGMFEYIGLATADRDHSTKIRKGETYAQFKHTGSGKTLHIELGLPEGSDAGSLNARLRTQVRSILSQKGSKMKAAIAPVSDNHQRQLSSHQRRGELLAALSAEHAACGTKLAEQSDNILAVETEADRSGDDQAPPPKKMKKTRRESQKKLRRVLRQKRAGVHKKKIEKKMTVPPPSFDPEYLEYLKVHKGPGLPADKFPYLHFYDVRAKQIRLIDARVQPLRFKRGSTKCRGAGEYFQLIAERKEGNLHRFVLGPRFYALKQLVAEMLLWRDNDSDSD